VTAVLTNGDTPGGTGHGGGRGGRFGQSPERALTIGVRAALVLAWAMAGLVCVHRVTATWRMDAEGLDLRPLYDSGRALLHHRPLYLVPRFVYPPDAAYLSLPLQLVPYGALRRGVVIGEVMTLVAFASALSRLLLPARWWVLGAGLGVVLLVYSDISSWSIWLENVSLLLAPAALIIVWAFSRGRWGLGCGLLVATLLVKPVLLPLLLVTTVLMLTMLLAGSISQVHYLFVLLPGLCAVPWVSRRPALLGGALQGLVLLLWVGDWPSHGHTHADLQVRLVTAESLVMLTTALAMLDPRGGFQPRRTAAGSSPRGHPV
jgi:hypothetical protein